MITTTFLTIAAIAVLCAAFGIVADVLCALFKVAAYILAIPLAIIGIVVCAVLFAWPTTVIASPFIVIGIVIGCAISSGKKRGKADA
ncbi:MAG: hypothetical protein SOI26_10520 [Coriobacteriales bacterium]|jgi:hypothetical protein